MADSFLVPNTEYTIECCDLWNSFIKNVRLSNDDVLDACTAEQCYDFAHIKFLQRELQNAFSFDIGCNFRHFIGTIFITGRPLCFIVYTKQITANMTHGVHWLHRK